MGPSTGIPSAPCGQPHAREPQVRSIATSWVSVPLGSWGRGSGFQLLCKKSLCRGGLGSLKVMERRQASATGLGVGAESTKNSPQVSSKSRMAKICRGAKGGLRKVSHSPEKTQQQNGTSTQVAETTGPSCAHLTCPLRTAGRSGPPWPEPPGLPPLVHAGMCPLPNPSAACQPWAIMSGSSLSAGELHTHQHTSEPCPSGLCAQGS